MNLDEQQRKKVAEWIAQGLRLADIQARLASEFKLSLTYMDVRFLVDDLKLTPKDQERPKPPATLEAPVSAPDKAGKALKPEPEPAPATPGGVSVAVDTVARVGAVASGKVTFSDGNSAEWYFDQTGRLGLAPKQPGYRPSAADLQQFQMELETELSKMGY
jgi:hypothetical protein